MNINHIRNFCIIAHIDHGKSTLADRFLEVTGTVRAGEMQDQVLDDMDLERERGITIKAHAITMKYESAEKKKYTLNLIDTPGHVDFSYEVSRSLAACEGAILVVDAAQGVEAQTISTLYQAIEGDLTIIPVINKVDLPSAQIDVVKQQIIDLIGCEGEEILLASAKAGTGVTEILEAVIERIPAPEGELDVPLRALVFDSVYDSYRGAIAYIRVVHGEIRTGMNIKFFTTGKVFEVAEVGTLSLKKDPQKSISVGEVGYCIAGIKDVQDTKVGDTIMDSRNPAKEPLPGYREVLPMVYAGMFPTVSEDYEDLRTALDKLRLNDASLVFEPETSVALGFGFRVGFLGLLHMEIVQERLEREYGLDMLTTMPNVEYRVSRADGQMIEVDNPAELPSRGDYDFIEEPFIRAQIIVPKDFIGNVMKLSMDRRGIYKNTSYIDPTRADITYEFPLSEIIFDFFDKLKSMTKGYASFDYDFIGFRKGDLVKLDILINGDPVDALSHIVHKDKAFEWGRKICKKMKEIIPRQMFEVAIQAAIGSKIISRETVRAMRKDVTSKCYGGDISRKRKLLEKQKEGKKRMKQLGKVEIPQDAFLAILKVD
ncbi:MAG: elongation factor 4 [Calditrichaeota bacterium]|nr:MAG: elongation factor 4 [Calditrichota bacterium]